MHGPSEVAGGPDADDCEDIRDVAEPEPTVEMIGAAMTKAEARVCVGSDRCYPFPDRLDDARKTCTPKGRCRVGLIVSQGGRESFDVWLEVSSGLVKLIPQAKACGR